MQLVVVSAVAAAVMAATKTFNSTSQNREFFMIKIFGSIIFGVKGVKRSYRFAQKFFDLKVQSVASH